MGASDIEAGKAFVRLYTKGDLREGLEKAEHNLKHFARTAKEIGEGLTIAGAGILGPMGLALHQLTESKDLIGNNALIGEEVAKQFDRMKGAGLNVSARLGESLLPLLEKLAERVSEGARAVGRFIDANQGLIQGLAIGAAAAAAGGVALMAFGKAAKFVAGTCDALKSIAGILFTPTGLGLAAIAAAAAGLMYLWSRTDHGREVIGELHSDWTEALEGMAADVQNGRIAHAFDILWTTLKLSFARFIQDIANEADKLAKKLLPDTGKRGVAGLVNQSWAGFQDIWAGVKAIGRVLDGANHRGETGKQAIEAGLKQFDKETGRIHGGAGDINRQLDKMKQQGTDPFSEMINQLEKQLRGLTGNAKQFIPPQRHAPSEMGIGFAAKGLFSHYGIRESLGVADEVRERAAVAAEQTAENTKGLKDKLDNVIKAVESSAMTFA